MYMLFLAKMSWSLDAAVVHNLSTTMIPKHVSGKKCMLAPEVELFKRLAVVST